MIAPAEIHSNPALLYLYYRIEKSLGIKTTGESLLKLNDYLEKQTGYSFTENPKAFEDILGSPQKIYEISNLLTINETYFFREEIHFEVLNKLLPQLARLNRPINILSAATSIGCEAYSIAMLLDNYSKNERTIEYTIDAFDINIESIETAKNGHYTANSFRTDGSSWKYIMDLYLISDNGAFTVSPDIKNKINFFTHNIMDNINKQYDIIFFRNALIYFFPQNRPEVLDNLVNSLYENGYLFLGISETPSGTHPQLVNKYLFDAFFFQKNTIKPVIKKSDIEIKSNNLQIKLNDKNQDDEKHIKTDRHQQTEIPVNYPEITEILKIDEGEPNAKNIHEILLYSEGRLAASLTGSELSASVIYFLSVQDFDSAGLVLSYLEKSSFGVLSLFLRGEYHLHQDNIKEAEDYYEKAAAKDNSFWPALYRIVTLAAEGNITRYKYKIKKACESLELGRDSQFECLMGGFSPDYFKRILEKKLELE